MNLFKRKPQTESSLDDFRNAIGSDVDTALDRITGGTLAYCHNGGGGGGYDFSAYDAGPLLNSGADRTLSSAVQIRSIGGF